MGKMICVGCRKTVGKDTTADYTIPWLESKYTIIRTSFVGEARDYVSKVFPQFSDNAGNKDEYRDAMISVVKATLDIDELAFTKSLVRRVQESSEDTLFVVPDLRRNSEYSYCKDQLGDSMITIRVDRGEKVDAFGEGDMDDDKFYDLIIDNNGTLEELEEKSKEVVNLINGVKVYE
jgi:hypothetical protein